MNIRFVRRARVAAVAVVVSTMMVGGGMLTGTGAANAAPCGNGGTGSTGSLGSSGSLGSGSAGSGSLGSGSGGSSNPDTGPQGNLPVYRGPSTNTVAWITGPKSPNRTFSRFGISGTDLGISWDNGSGQTLMAFGDTFGDCAVAGQQWRHNVLLRSNDDDFTDGVSVPDAVPGVTESGSVVGADAPNFATQLIPAIGVSQVEVTTIPTAAISLPDGNGGYTQYMNYMSVRSWGDAGHWVTNFSAIAYSTDNGQTWDTDPNTILINAPVTLALPGALREVTYNNGKFQQSAYFRGHGADAGYIYQLGTPNGRFGAAFLARFVPGDIRNLENYEYWTGSGPGRGWKRDITAIPDDGSAQILPPPVTEASVSWSPYLNKYMMLDGDNGIRIRTADHPEGPWSAPTYLVPPVALVVYGPMIQPHSPAILGTGKDLYFNASRWSDYNVMLLHSDLSKIPH
ncbi:DUF4185 domain-containing protein [Gordonia polyisoprenivorans]|uniref:DUF4185 domain-containing protein n=1 Tax=Gordonia polyisoprenivorans TaxID=84595 RepID=UPI001FCAD871|nr:DUF4185 domain-containing protein [Gordonia polyisoprenivorans]